MSDDLYKQIEFLLKNDHLEVKMTDDLPLVTSGLLNSLQIVELASWMEAHYGISFDGAGFNMYDFDTIKKMKLLVKKMKGSDR
jgi:acyl carrier protein